jgi:hypothetical protein
MHIHDITCIILDYNVSYHFIGREDHLQLSSFVFFHQLDQPLPEGPLR